MTGPVYTIESLGHHDLPDELSRAPDATVESVLRRAAAFIGFHEVEITRVASVIGGSCIASVDVVASFRGTNLLVAKPLI